MCMWKGFCELLELRWVDGQLPNFIGSGYKYLELMGCEAIRD